MPLAGFELDVSNVDEDNPLGTPVLDMSPSNLKNGPTFSGYVDLTFPNWSDPYHSTAVRYGDVDPSAGPEDMWVSGGILGARAPPPLSPQPAAAARMHNTTVARLRAPSPVRCLPSSSMLALLAGPGSGRPRLSRQYTAKPPACKPAPGALFNRIKAGRHL